jgi:hypothetical protein
MIQADQRDPDLLIQDWQQKLAAITANANELADAQSTKRIRIRAREARYQGTTKQAADQALTQLSALMDDYLLLARVVDEAAALRKGGLFSLLTDSEQKVMALLNGPSIDRPVAAVPWQKRELLGAALPRKAMSPSALLELMQQEFEQARDALAAIDTAESRVEEETLSLRAAFASMEERAARIASHAGRPSFIELQDLASDPLNALEGLASLRRQLAAWSALLDGQERARLDAQSGVDRAVQALAQLKECALQHQQQCRQIADTLQAEVSSALHPFPHAQVDMLSSWCETLENSLQAGHWEAVLVGTSRINQALQEALATARQLMAETTAVLSEVAELNGLFGALKAKEKAQGGTNEDLAADAALREQVENALTERPLRLDAARALLNMYQHRLAKRQPQK